MSTCAQDLNAALYDLLVTDARVCLIGEDIRDPYGGAFKITRGLSDAFGERVLNTPISEAAITGLGIGMALRGLRPVVEIMFGDFATLAADQLINNAAKLAWMYDHKVAVPLTVRLPMGGRRGYGPTHSQCLERLFAGVPGLRLVAPSIYHRPGELLRASVVDDDEPVLFIENKIDYARPLAQIVDGMIGNWFVRCGDGRYPTVRLSMTDFEDDVMTVVCYGGMACLAVQAMEQLLCTREIAAEVIVPSCIAPLDAAPIVESLRRTGRLVTAEEGHVRHGWGAELVARMAAERTEVGPLLRGPAMRIGAGDRPIGNARHLEDAVLPDAQDLMAACWACVQESAA